MTRQERLRNIIEFFGHLGLLCSQHYSHKDFLQHKEKLFVTVTITYCENLRDIRSVATKDG